VFRKGAHREARRCVDDDVDKDTPGSKPHTVQLRGSRGYFYRDERVLARFKVHLFQPLASSRRKLTPTLLIHASLCTDYNLMNKLGATLANSNRSAEALPHYIHALKIKQRFSRGWLNMAIAHSNLRHFDEACRCYLQTLALNPQAVHIWSYLRIALTLAERWDLLPLATEQSLDAFKAHFEFVL